MLVSRRRQPISNEVEENLTLFFRRFLNTPEEMDARKDPQVLLLNSGE
jgi:hypothetical protein